MYLEIAKLSDYSLLQLDGSLGVCELRPQTCEIAIVVAPAAVYRRSWEDGRCAQDGWSEQWVLVEVTLRSRWPFPRRVAQNVRWR